MSNLPSISNELAQEVKSTLNVKWSAAIRDTSFYARNWLSICNSRCIPYVFVTPKLGGICRIEWNLWQTPAAKHIGDPTQKTARLFGALEKLASATDGVGEIVFNGGFFCGRIDNLPMGESHAFAEMIVTEIELLAPGIFDFDNDDASAPRGNGLGSSF
jgi:hypothetical protein